MNTTATKKLQYFVGKICTILTVGINKDFNLEQFGNFFTCRIEAIDADGVVCVHPITNCKSFFFLDKIVSISEEQEITEDHPAYKEIKQEVQKSEELMSSPFINHEKMANLVKQAKMIQKN